jgi:hypothetical protein
MSRDGLDATRRHAAWELGIGSECLGNLRYWLVDRGSCFSPHEIPVGNMRYKM